MFHHGKIYAGTIEEICTKIWEEADSNTVISFVPSEDCNFIDVCYKGFLDFLNPYGIIIEDHPFNSNLFLMHVGEYGCDATPVSAAFGDTKEFALDLMIESIELFLNSRGYHSTRIIAEF